MTKNKLIAGFFLAASLLLGSAGAEAATRYARTDGGTSTQCNGTVDAAYDGSGTAENCAWTLSAGISAMAGGDILIVKNGTHTLSAGISGIKDGTSNAYTVIAGQGFGNCIGEKPKIRNSTYINRLFDLTGTDYVRIECLDISDNSNCHSRSSGAEDCDNTADDWIRHAFYAESGSNHIFRDLYIHGVSYAFRGARVNNSTWERVKKYALYEGGYNGSHPTSNTTTVGEFTGTHTFTDYEIAFAGCSDDYPNEDVRTCIGQSGGGYGDAFGTYYTAGTWTFDRVNIHHNAQDGLDGRYFDSPATTTVKNSKFWANAGNQLKIWGPALVENNLINSNCSYFDHYGTAVDQCRADGNAIIILPDNCTGTCAILRYNTIAGESAALVQFASGGTTTDYTARMENNVIVGDTIWNGTTLTYALSNGAGISVGWYNNVIYNVRNSFCPSGSYCSNPQLLQQDTMTFDGRPNPTSPIVGTANTAYIEPEFDVLGNGRPPSPTPGAYEPPLP